MAKTSPRLLLYVPLIALAVILTACGGPPPAVPQAAIDDAVAFITQDPMVRDAAIRIEDRQIVLAIVANRAINQQYARQLGDNFARYFATATAGRSDDERLKEGPSKDYLGALWDHYDMQVIVAVDADNVLVQGAKARTAKAIRW